MIRIDLENDLVTVEEDGIERSYPMASAEAFSIISRAWLRAGWDNKYVYSFTWMGRPVIQLPDDMLRIQELLYSVKPDVIIETGIAHGGSLIYYASLCKTMDRGRVIGVDVEIRPHNRKAIEAHEMFPYITLIEGDSIAPAVVDSVKALVKPGERAMVFLDSCHTKAHVLAELEAYSPLVGIGSYIVAMDGIMEGLVGAPRSQPDWHWNNPAAAALEFEKGNSNFRIVEPAIPFNEGNITNRVTYWPNAFIQRIR